MYLCELFLLAHIIYGGVHEAATFYIKYILAIQDVAAMFGVIYIYARRGTTSCFYHRALTTYAWTNNSGVSPSLNVFSPECFVGFMRI